MRHQGAWLLSSPAKRRKKLRRQYFSGRINFPRRIYQTRTQLARQVSGHTHQQKRDHHLRGGSWQYRWSKAVCSRRELIILSPVRLLRAFQRHLTPRTPSLSRSAQRPPKLVMPTQRSRKLWSFMIRSIKLLSIRLRIWKCWVKTKAVASLWSMHATMNRSKTRFIYPLARIGRVRLTSVKWV